MYCATTTSVHSHTLVLILKTTTESLIPKLYCVYDWWDFQDPDNGDICKNSRAMLMIVLSYYHNNNNNNFLNPL